MDAGDFRLGKTFDVKFTTINSSGVPTTLAGSPAVAAYPDNSTTEITAGITLSVDFDARTGLHNVRVVASSGNGYATATNYALALTAGTVDGTSVVGYVVGHFSIENRSALMPTAADRTFDVSSTGEGGVDWANVGSPTTSLALTGTTIANLTNAPTAGDLTATMKASVNAEVDTALADINLNKLITITGSVNDTGATTTQFITNLASSTDDFYADMVLIFTSGALAGQPRIITNYVGSTKTVTFDEATTSAPANGVTFAIVSLHAHNDTQIATSVWTNGTRTLSSLGFAFSSGDFGAGCISANALAADTITDAKVASDVTIASVTGAVGSVTGNVGGNVAGSVGSVSGSVGSVTGNVGGNVTGSVGGVATGGITRASFAADTGLQTVRSSTAQAGASTTITLDASASSTNDFYNNCRVFITGGTGAGQSRRILDYVGSTQVATVRAWTANPDNTSTFAVIPEDSVWDDITADHVTSGSTGNSLNSAGSAGDPWSTTLPGSYGANTAGRIVGRSLPDVVAGASGGLFIAGTNAATTVTTALTTTFTGNLTGNVGGNVTGSIGSLATQAKADVNAEVVDTLTVDTYAQPSQESPPATTTFGKMLAYLYKFARNKVTQSATEFKLYADDATTVDQKAIVSDDGTTTTRGEISSGP